MPFDFLHFRRPALCRSRFVASVCAAFACLLLSGTSIAAPGQLDPTFGIGGIARANFSPPGSTRTEHFVRSLATIGAGAILAAGTCPGAPSTTDYFDPCYFKMDIAGNLDVAFSGSGRRIVRGDAAEALKVVAAAGGAITLESCGGFTAGLCVRRILANGSDDTSFGVAGVAVARYSSANSIVVFSGPGALLQHSSGHIYVGGACGGIVFFGLDQPADFCLMRMDNAGAIDRQFGSDGLARTAAISDDFLLTLIEQRDGKIVAAGDCSGKLCFVRLLLDGTVDSTFGTGGRTVVGDLFQRNGESADAALLLDDSIIAVGSCGTAACIVKLTADGFLDTSFGVNGVIESASSLGIAGIPRSASVVVQLDGNAVIAGLCNGATCALRLRPDGSVDTVFTSNAQNIVPPYSTPNYYYFYGKVGLARQADGNLLLGASCTVNDGAYSSYADMCVFRLQRGAYDPVTCALNVDANQAVEATTDATLIARYLLGLRGDALTTGALGQNPTRTGQALENHLASLNLDADGDGQSLAMTDGLLILRAMLGLTGGAPCSLHLQ